MKHRDEGRKIATYRDPEPLPVEEEAKVVSAAPRAPVPPPGSLAGIASGLAGFAEAMRATAPPGSLYDREGRRRR